MRRTTKLISLVLAVMLVLSCFTGLTAITASAEDETPDVYSVFGSSAAIFGDVWFAANPATEMTLDETDGLYKITFEDVEPTQMLQFKVLKNHNEDFSWGAPGTDQNYTVNIEQTCDLTITFDPVQEIVNAIGDYVVVPQGLQIDNVIAVGNGEDTYLNGANWDPCDPSNAMMELEPGVWAITMEDIYAFDNYNIKFAANSIDDDQNPVANPWGINWGAAAEQLYPTEQWIPAVYNGKNAIFEVEDDGSVVRIILDLRNFNFVTKEGARFKIQINPEEDAPYDDTEEPTTVAPTTVSPDPEPTTTEPVVETTIEAPTTEAPTTKPVNPDATTFTVKTTSNLFKAAQRTYSSDSEGGIPDTVTVVYYADVDTMFRLQSIQAELEYDTSVLTFDPAKNGEYDEDYEEYDVTGILPVAGGLGDVNADVPGVIKFAVAKWDGMRLKKSGELIPIIKVVFDVAPGASGTTVVNNEVAACAFCDPKTETDYIVYNVNGLQSEGYSAVTGTDGAIGSFVDEPSDEEVPTDAPTTVQPDPEPTTTEPVPEPTTEASTTVTPTNPDPGDGLTVNAISNVWSTSSKTYSGTPETVTVTYFADLSVSTLRLQNIQFSVKYDPSVLSIDPAKNAVWDEDEEEYDYSQTFPVASGSGDTNFDDYTDMVKFAVSKWDGLRLSKNGELIPIAQIVFDVAPGATGSTDVIMEFGVVTFVNSKTEEEYIVHSTAGGLNQENYEYITSIGEFRTVVDDEIEILPAKAPTCTETGLTEGKRNTVTGEIIVPQNVIPALGHAVVTDPAVPVTCTVDGKTEGSHCSRCNEVLVAQQVVPAQGHKNVSVSKVEPTCTEPGHTAGLQCSVCGIAIMGMTPIPAKGHTPVNDSAVAATCTEPGHTAGTHCSVCNEILSGNEVIPAKGHTPVNDPAVAVTCTTDGRTAGTHCSTCNEILSGNEVIPAPGHKNVNVPKVEATCTEPGHTAGLKCSVCGITIMGINTIPAKGHTPVNDAAVAATCTEPGHTAGTHCSTCNEILSGNVVIPAKGHTPVNDPAVAATCTEPGHTAGTHCSTCNEILSGNEVIPAQGHKNVNVPKVDATCTEPGHTAGLKCSVCGITIMGITTIPAKGHTPVNDPAVAATCTEPGHTAGTHCSTCNEILSGNEPIEALGHDVINKPGRPATYTQTGLTDGQFCNRCKKWIVQQQVIPKLVSENKIGDINRDGYVDVLDAITAQKFAADKTSLDDEQMYIGDVNNDGNVDVLDAILIQKYAAEKISGFPKKE